ncbi:hypothetical protein LAZ67_22002293 [Cordylochernes scorpioides]|uniref:Maturase K n=1 Tax=Cordylochernes scorpioides TaxID=51811 RepID=A0ABY6LTR6_9ARAC|nr:hypothetical protein LAZ67_22002293 [Cordylochernes scorpioides]
MQDILKSKNVWPLLLVLNNKHKRSLRRYLEQSGVLDRCSYSTGSLTCGTRRRHVFYRDMNNSKSLFEQWRQYPYLHILIKKHKYFSIHYINWQTNYLLRGLVHIISFCIYEPSLQRLRRSCRRTIVLERLYEVARCLTRAESERGSSTTKTATIEMYAPSSYTEPAVTAASCETLSCTSDKSAGLYSDNYSSYKSLDLSSSVIYETDEDRYAEALRRNAYNHTIGDKLFFYLFLIYIYKFDLFFLQFFSLLFKKSKICMLNFAYYFFSNLVYIIPGPLKLHIYIYKKKRLLPICCFLKKKTPSFFYILLELQWLYKKWNDRNDILCVSSIRKSILTSKETLLLISKIRHFQSNSVLSVKKDNTKDTLIRHMYYRNNTGQQSTFYCNNFPTICEQ